MRIVAEPLDYLLVLHLIDKRIRRLLVRRIENKNRIVTNAPVGRRNRLYLCFEFSNFRPDARVVVDGKLRRREFNDYELRLSVIGSYRFCAAVETDCVE